MSVNDRLDRFRGELDEEVSSRVRTPAYADIVRRHARRRRTRLAAGGAAVVVVAGGVLGGVLATVPGGRPNAVPPAGLTVTSPPASTQGGPFTSAPLPGTTSQTYPPPGASYVIVPSGSQFAWTDLRSSAHGRFGPSNGPLLYSPSVSTDGRRVAFLEKGTATGMAIAVWDLDTRRVTTVSEGGAGEVGGPSISPDGTRVIWYEAGVGIKLATVGTAANQESQLSVILPNVAQATWDGNDALAYLAYPLGSGSAEAQCAVVQKPLAAGAPTHCLLPTATLQSVFAVGGSRWQPRSIVGIGGGGDFALLVTTNAPGTGASHEGIAILRVGAEATPFKVLSATITPDLLGAPVLIDGGTQVLYTQGSAGAQHSEIVSVDVASGSKTTITVPGATPMVNGAVGAPSG